MRAPNVLTISPAQPFLQTFVAALTRGEVIRGYAPAGPLDLAEATIYVPTQRSAQALADAFLAHRGTSSVVLPHILPLGALEGAETPLLFGDPEPELFDIPLPPAASRIWRRLRLASLIQAWAKAIGGALRSVDRQGRPSVDEREAFRVATSAVDAFHLAGDLADLVDELLIEDVHWQALDPLSLPEFDDYWRITTTFLSVAFREWPKILAQSGYIDPARRQIALVDARSRDLAGGRGGPVVAIGSTGTNKATARLLAAIARAPRGAVVLPGLDRDLDEDAWAIISGRLREDQEPSFGHPQAAMARLLPVLAVARRDVRPLGRPDPFAAARARFVAEAARPADTTDRWPAFRESLAPGEMAEALAGVTLIEAADEREEALCLALAMREILEVPGRTGALVTPDRDLARRVRGELLRWGVEVNDTGGEPLAARPLGILARLIVASAASHLAARDVTALLAHPFARFGRERAEVARLAALLEITVLRPVAARGRGGDAVFDEARRLAASPHAHPAQASVEAADWDAMRQLWHSLDDALAPLCDLRNDASLSQWVAAHRAALIAVLGGAAQEDAGALDALFTELEAGDPTLLFSTEGYGMFFGRIGTEIALRNTRHPHPRLQIFGLIEARLMRADVMLLGGLDETVWPPAARTDPFLNRPMRKALGLTPPERRLGQTAHDFAQAMGGETAILSRAAKRGGSPCVPSRFLLRLEALGPGGVGGLPRARPPLCRPRPRARPAGTAAGAHRPPAPDPGDRPAPARPKRHADRDAAARSLRRLRRPDPQARAPAPRRRRDRSRRDGRHGPRGSAPVRRRRPRCARCRRATPTPARPAESRFRPRARRPVLCRFPLASPAQGARRVPRLRRRPARDAARSGCRARRQVGGTACRRHELYAARPRRPDRPTP